MAKEPKIALDPQTARCLYELREMCNAVEAGKLSLLDFSDNIACEHDGMHRRLGLHAVFIPAKGSS